MWFPRKVLRPLGLWGPSRAKRAGGGSITGAGRKGIGVIAGARTVWSGGSADDGFCSVGRGERGVTELAQDVVRTPAEFARDREAGAVVVEPVGNLQVVGVVGRAAASGALGGFEEGPAQQLWALVGEVTGGAFLV